MIFLPNLFHSFFYEKIFLKSTQVALIQKEDNFIIRQKNYYRNVFTDHAPVILDLEDKDIGLELPIDNEIHYFKLFLTVDVNKKDSLLKAADRYLITRKGVDVEFLKPKLKNIINDFLKENENLSKKTFLHFINNSMKTSEELNCIDFSDIDIYKKNRSFSMIKGLSQIFSKKNKDINFLLPPEREQSNVFGFGERHTITIELKEELSKRHIEFNMDNIVKLTSSLLAIFYSKDETLVQEKNVKSLFLNSRIVPIITVKEKVSIFINPEDTEWHSIYWGTSGKGKSYFSSQMLTEQIKCCLTHYTYTLLNFMSENETNDNDLIQINFQNDWENFLDRIQRILLKS